jgi:hypothetical protein
MAYNDDNPPPIWHGLIGMLSAFFFTACESLTMILLAIARRYYPPHWISDSSIIIFIVNLIAFLGAPVLTISAYWFLFRNTFHPAVLVILCIMILFAGIYVGEVVLINKYGS